MFSGFMSRCTIPRACAADSAPQTCVTMCTSRETDNPFSCSISFVSSIPSRNSITMKGEPSSKLPTSVTSMMCSFPTAVAACASR